MLRWPLGRDSGQQPPEQTPDISTRSLATCSRTGWRQGAWPGLIAAAVLIPLTIAAAAQFPSITLASTLLILLLEVVVVALISSFPVALLTAGAHDRGSGSRLNPPAWQEPGNSTCSIREGGEIAS